MDFQRSASIKYTFLSLAAALTLAVSVADFGGVLVFGGGHSFADAFYVFYPLLAFPLSLLSFFSAKIGTVAFSLYVFVDWLFQFVISLPLISLNPFSSIASTMLVCAALLLWTGFVFGTTAREVKTG